MKQNNNISVLLSLIVFLTVSISCSENEKEDNVFINELMVSNRTGLQNEKNVPTDWIEIKNGGNDAVDLKGYRIVVTKDTLKLSAFKNKKENKKVKEPRSEWSFPKVQIEPGQCLVVFAEKLKEEESSDLLTANLKLPKEGGTVQLFSSRGKLLSEVKYSEMEPDQSIAFQTDSTYLSTFWQSPGYENTRQGYEAAIKKIESQHKSPLLIWELMSRATHSYENWVELKNVSDKPINLSDYKISKKSGKNEGWTLPDRTLAPGEQITIRMAGNKANKKSGVEAPFKLGSAETVILLKDGKYADGLNARLTQFGGSIGRLEGKNGFYFFSKPTPNQPNDGEGKLYIAEKPELNLKPGIYGDKERVVLKLKKPNKKVHYTLDGSEPTMNSPLFKDSLVLSEPTVVRSFAEGDSVTMKSNIATASYMIGVEHDLPIINISLNNADLHDHYKGIYANGSGFDEEFPHYGANFWKNWTKKAYFELFDDSVGYSSDCGLKIFGGFSRALAKKSFRVKFRGEFGNTNANYDFFETGEPDDFEDLVLRSGSQDYNRHMIKDEFFTSLVQSGSPTLLTQMYRPVALYINAKYFGLYYLREKIDKNFVARKLNLPNDSIDLYLSGPSPYMQLVNRISNLDMSKKENFEFAKKNIDLQGLIDFKIGNIFAGKTDVGNIRYARSRDKDSDKKWRFIFYDIDYSWAPNGKPSARTYLSTSPDAIIPEKAIHNVLIERMLRNKEFRQMFLERLSYHLSNTYTPENTKEYFDKFIEKIRPEMKHNCKRWTGLSYEQWEKNIESFRSRFKKRPENVLNDLRSHLSITQEENKKYFSHLGY